MRFRAYVRSLNPRLPRAVVALQVGGLANAFGNGIVFPFTLIYLHNVRGFSLATAGVIVATSAAVSLVAGPASGPLVDRIGGRRMLGLSLAFLAAGFGSYPLVHDPWQGFVVSAVAGVGAGAFWPSQSTLLASLTPPSRRPAAWGMQRVVMNLGIGIGGLVGGLIASTAEPRTFTILFLVDAATFVVYSAVLFRFVPDPDRPVRDGGPPGRYLDVLRHRIFLGLAAVNTVVIASGLAQLEILPAFAKNHAGLTEREIGLLFFVNTIVIVILQLPITKLNEGRRRMPTLAAVGLVSAVCWAAVPIAGTWATGLAATALLAVVVGVFGIGECLHGAIWGPLVADLANPRLLGRYMAMNAFSWQLGFTIGPAAGALLLSVSPSGLWFAAAGVSLAASVGALLLEPVIPREVRRTPAEAVA